ncbi:MAG: nitrilase-related carbon-nitrogen hydrolase [Myxococcota bacterium]|nr:nitrilase-related carbon-nitrogen hydrolase [Myxococcota bacterium]
MKKTLSFYLLSTVGIFVLFGCNLQAPPILHPNPVDPTLVAEADCDESPIEKVEPENKPKLPELVQANGGYKTVPLEKENIVLKIVQSDASPVEDFNTPEMAMQANLTHVTQMGYDACDQGDSPDIILFHEFPFSGYVYGSRREKLAIAIDIPGKETDAMAELAKYCDAYVIFGSYAKDSDWPGHVLSLTTIINRQGEILKKVWKPRNIKRFYSTFEITTTTVESVRTKFREKYGVEEELPVIRTEFGNIAVSTAQLDPLVFAAFAMQGAELILRTATLYFETDAIHTAMVNNVYSAMANIPHESKYGGRSLVVNPEGEVVAQAQGNLTETIVTARIPIGDFRRGRMLPQYTTEFTRHIFEQYQPEIPMDHLDLPEEELPVNGSAMKALLDRISRWLN